MYTIAFRLLQSPADAEDCVHDVLVRLWGDPARARFQAETLAAYLGVCVRNEALARLRSSARRRAIVRRLPVNEVSETEFPDAVAAARVRTALQALPSEQRTAILLAYENGLTHREIAERTGEPLGTIKSRISLGVRKLQGMLGTQREVR